MSSNILSKIGMGGSNPKIFTICNKKNVIRNENIPHLLLDNNNNFRVLVKCKKLDEKIKNGIINKYKSNNSGKLKNYTNILNNEVYLKYISIEYKKEKVIIDLEDLEIKENVSLEYLDYFDLDNLEGIKYENISISKKMNSDLGLFISGKNVKAFKVLERIIKIELENNIITIRIAKDRKNLILRNSIEISYTNLNEMINYSGLLMRNDTYYLNKIKELKQINELK